MTDDTNDLDAGLDISQDAVKFANVVNIAQLYYQFFVSLSILFRTASTAHAIEYFYEMLPPFLILEDKVFREQFIKIEAAYSNDMVKMFQLHHTELTRLLARAGIIPRPDVILKLYAEDAPRSVEELRHTDEGEEDAS